MKSNQSAAIAALATASGRQWHVPDTCAPDLTSQIIANRKLSDRDIALLTDDRLASQFPDPSVIMDMDQAAQILAKAIAGQQSIHIHADYDVDGATSSAILRRYLKACGHAYTSADVPNREYGYGFGEEAAEAVLADPPDVLVLLDCGTHNHATIAQARAEGTEVVVIDHHQPGDTLPIASALVNPHRADENEAAHSLRTLCTAGLALLATVATTRALRARGYWQGRDEPHVRELIDLAALGTVCDVMPLTGLNRALVRHGLIRIRTRTNTGLAALCDVSGVKADATVTSLGFHLGPRINAGGRIGQARLGSDLLTTDDPAKAAQIAGVLDGLNRDRQTIEAAVREAAEAQINPDDDIVIVAGKGWHEGVIGIVAGRIKEQVRKPTIVLSIADNGIAKGSGRSMTGVNLGEAMLAARAAGLLSAGGGHAMACGLTTTAAQIDDLRAFLNQHYRAAAEQARTADTARADAVLHTNDITAGMIESIEALAPYGQGWPRPKFIIGPCQIQALNITAKGHAFCTLVDETGAIKAKAWRAEEGQIATMLKRGGQVYALVTLEIDTWNGRNSPAATIEDIATLCEDVALV